MLTFVNVQGGECQRRGRQVGITLEKGFKIEVAIKLQNMAVTKMSKT